jgi:hypothetical protein
MSIGVKVTVVNVLIRLNTCSEVRTTLSLFLLFFHVSRLATMVTLG